MGKIIWVMLFGVRGVIHALPFLIGDLIISTGFFLPSQSQTGLLTPIVEKAFSDINSLSFGLLLLGFFIWFLTWIDDYRNYYLPNLDRYLVKSR